MPQSYQDIRPDLTIDPHPYTVASIFFSCFVGVFACVTLLGGWIFGIVPLRSLISGYATLAPSTAVALMLLALSTLLLSLKTQGLERSAAVYAAAVLVLAGVNALLLFLHTGRGIDDALFNRDLLNGTLMSPVTTLALMLIAVNILLAHRRDELGQRLYIALSSINVAIAAVTLTAYAFDVQALYDIGPFRTIALHAALCLLGLSLALLSARPTWWWMKTFSGQGEGSRNLRILMVTAVPTPWLFCWLALAGSRYQIFFPNFRLSMIAVFSIAVLIVCLLITSHYQNQAEMRRAAAITDLKQRTDELGAAIRERDLLLREVYHRVKNNLQLIEAMLYLQMGRTQSEEAKAIIQATRGRIHMMGLVHQKLLERNNYVEVDLNMFFSELVQHLAEAFGAELRGITVRFDGESAVCELEDAIPIGMLVNELLSNAFKHAFPEERKGHVNVSLKSFKDHFRLVIQDDGKGPYHAEKGPGASSSLGSEIIEALIGQLKGTLSITHQDGTRAEINVPYRKS